MTLMRWTNDCPSFVQGTRLLDPGDARAALEPLLHRFGITRMANVTGLDRLGIPVWMSIRPESRSLSVSQGKGLTMDAAWMSAAMEAIELWHAEQHAIPIKLARMMDLSPAQRDLVAAIPRQPGAQLDPQQLLLWASGEDMLGGGEVIVPYECVHLDAAQPAVPNEGVFVSSSNGLASGHLLEEAVLHAMFELVERHSHARWSKLAAVDQEQRRIDPLSGFGEVRRLVEQCHDAGFQVLAWDLTSKIRIPVIAVVLIDCQGPTTSLLGAAAGYGCHLRSDVAFVRALTEAAQSRLTLIAGSRNDLSDGDYRQRTRVSDDLEHFRRLAGNPPSGSMSDIGELSVTSFAKAIEAVLSRLTEAHLPHAVAVDLTLDAHVAHVVRVVIPGLEAPALGH